MKAKKVLVGKAEQIVWVGEDQGGVGYKFFNSKAKFKEKLRSTWRSGG
jgi:hypothetical protein